MRYFIKKHRAKKEEKITFENALRITHNNTHCSENDARKKLMQECTLKFTYCTISVRE